MYRANQTASTSRTLTAAERQENKDTLIRQMVYDLTMWYSIENVTKRTRYTSRYVQEFINFFNLENEEIPFNGDAEASSDGE
jgi:hypothetical protein